MSPVCKMADNGLFTVDQMVKVVLFYAETKSVVATRGRFRAHFGTKWAPCKQTIYRLSLGTIFQPMRINSVPDVKCFCNNKNVMCTINVMTFHVPPCILKRSTEKKVNGGCKKTCESGVLIQYTRPTNHALKIKQTRRTVSFIQVSALPAVPSSGTIPQVCPP